MFRYLGVHLDRRLSFAFHSDVAASKAKKAIGVLCRNFRKLAPTFVLETVYHDCIHSAMLYGAEIWWPSAQCHQVKLERTHRFMLRLISNDFSRQSTYNDLLSHANEIGSRVWVPICRTVAIRRTILVYKFWNGIRFIPPGCLIPVTERRSRRLRTHDLQICLPSAHSFLHPSIVLWNSLSFEIVHSQLKTFDSYCKSNLFFEHIVDRGFVTVL